MPEIYPFTPPAIPHSGVYYFQTGSGVQYEVRFGRKQGDLLSVNLVFGVLNEEYNGEEYVLTNKGEFYSVMATIDAIVKDFLAQNPNVHTVEFAGEPKTAEKNHTGMTKRTRIYLRHAQRTFQPPLWKMATEGNKVTIEKQRQQKAD